MKVAVLMGGKSREREISLRSGKNVSAALRRKGYDAIEVDPANEIIPSDIEAAYLVTHGRYGEDGCLQGMLEMMGIPYTGSGVLASALAMNKKAMKHVLTANGIPTPKSGKGLKPPIIIKPASEGSSIGITRIKEDITLDEIQKIIDLTTSEFGDVLIEQLIEGREITVGIVDEQPLPILELVPNAEYYSYEAKYTPGGTEFLLPAPLPDDITHKMQQMALRAHQALGCEGLSRVDIMLDSDMNGYVIDINTLPGMTDQSDLPAEARAAGIEFDDLVERILLSAFKNNKPKT
ncbi:MAG: D-alanine--D-alanine ligase [Candidatus Margulisiibacteriota bacterium]